MYAFILTLSGCINYAQMDWKTKIAWILNNLTIVQAPIVSVMYWVIVFGKKLFIQFIITYKAN